MSKLDLDAIKKHHENWEADGGPVSKDNVSAHLDRAKLIDEVDRLHAQVELLLCEREAAFERGVHLAAGSISVLSGFDGETVTRVRSRIYNLAGRRPPEKP